MGCVNPDLDAHGSTQEFRFQRNYSKLAGCTIDQLDHEPWGLGDMQMPPTSVRTLPDSQTVEVINVFTGVVNYRIKFVRVTEGETDVSVLARTAV